MNLCTCVFISFVVLSHEKAFSAKNKTAKENKKTQTALPDGMVFGFSTKQLCCYGILNSTVEEKSIFFCAEINTLNLPAPISIHNTILNRKLSMNAHATITQRVSCFEKIK